MLFALALIRSIDYQKSIRLKMNEQKRKRATYTGTISVFAFLSFDQPIMQPNCKKWNSHKSPVFVFLVSRSTRLVQKQSKSFRTLKCLYLLSEFTNVLAEKDVGYSYMAHQILFKSWNYQIDRRRREHAHIQT